MPRNAQFSHPGCGNVILLSGPSADDAGWADALPKSASGQLHEQHGLLLSQKPSLLLAIIARHWETLCGMHKRLKPFASLSDFFQLPQEENEPSLLEQFSHARNRLFHQQTEDDHVRLTLKTVQYSTFYKCFYMMLLVQDEELPLQIQFKMTDVQATPNFALDTARPLLTLSSDEMEFDPDSESALLSWQQAYFDTTYREINVLYQAYQKAIGEFNQSALTVQMQGEKLLQLRQNFSALTKAKLPLSALDMGDDIKLPRLRKINGQDFYNCLATAITSDDLARHYDTLKAAYLRGGAESALLRCNQHIDRIHQASELTLERMHSAKEETSSIIQAHLTRMQKDLEQQIATLKQNQKQQQAYQSQIAERKARIAHLSSDILAPQFAPACLEDNLRRLREAMADSEAIAKEIRAQIVAENQKVEALKATRDLPISALEKTQRAYCDLYSRINQTFPGIAAKIMPLHYALLDDLNFGLLGRDTDPIQTIDNFIRKNRPSLKLSKWQRFLPYASRILAARQHLAETELWAVLNLSLTSHIEIYAQKDRVCRNAYEEMTEHCKQQAIYHLYQKPKSNWFTRWFISAKRLRLSDHLCAQGIANIQHLHNAFRQRELEERQDLANAELQVCRQNIAALSREYQAKQALAEAQSKEHDGYAQLLAARKAIDALSEQSALLEQRIQVQNTGLHVMGQRIAELDAMIAPFSQADDDKKGRLSTSKKISDCDEANTALTSIHCTPLGVY